MKKQKSLIGQKFNMLTVIDELPGIKCPNGRIKYKIICQCDCGNIDEYDKYNVKSGYTKHCRNKLHTRQSVVGQRFGKLLVLKDLEDDKSRRMILCQCDCGNIKKMLMSNVVSGKSKSCGCEIGESVKRRLRKDISGQRFGRWTVIERDESNPKNWICKCDCGNISSVVGQSLKSGGSISCGCYKKEFTSKLLSLDLEGKSFGKLTVIKRDGTFIGSDGTHYSKWLCKCECGNVKSIIGHSLISNKIISCGCIASKGEEEITSILINKNVKFKNQYCFDDLKLNRKLRFDFAILDDDENIRCLIEYQGIQHFGERSNICEKWKNFGKQQREVTDVMKREYCLQNNIKLYEISYKDNISDSINEILELI